MGEFGEFRTRLFLFLGEISLCYLLMNNVFLVHMCTCRSCCLLCAMDCGVERIRRIIVVVSCFDDVLLRDRYAE